MHERLKSTHMVLVSLLINLAVVKHVLHTSVSQLICEQEKRDEKENLRLLSNLQDVEMIKHDTHLTTSLSLLP